MKKPIILIAIVLLLITSLTWAQKTKQSIIPAELINLKGTIKYIKSLDAVEFEHHDPSNIIKYNFLQK